MRKIPTDNYINFALIGNNVYDILFMKYLFLSQNVSASYCDKFRIDDKEKEDRLRNIAYYFGTKAPVLIDDKGLRKIFDKNGIPRTFDLPNLSSKDIINQIDNCLKNDAVYVCNANGNLDKYTMFILGYLMVMGQEIFFWDDIDKSEWLMSCISKKNKNGYKEVVQFPLEMIRTFAYPYLFEKHKLKMPSGKYREIIVNEENNIGVERNTEFNLQVKNQEEVQATISLLGSLKKQLLFMKETAVQLENNGYKVLAPRLSNVKMNTSGYIIFENDVSENPIVIESDFIEKCLKSECVLICNKDGYIGNTVMFEIGFLLAKNKKIQFIQKPTENWLMEVINYFSELKDKNILMKSRNS